MYAPRTKRSAPWARTDNGPAVIGHRGASGYRPENTLTSFSLAARQGADAWEVDVVPTRDGALICRHENELSVSTDVASHAQFADRFTTKTILGKQISGWFAEDFTLAEIKTLRALEPWPKRRPRSAIFNGELGIPTLSELLSLRSKTSGQSGRPLGLLIEPKYANHFERSRIPVLALLQQTLADHAHTELSSPVCVQTFEPWAIHALRERRSYQGPLMYIVSNKGAPDGPNPFGPQQWTYQEWLSPTKLATLAPLINGIGPEKSLVIDPHNPGPSTLVAQAHEHNLTVFTWTVRCENDALAAPWRSGRDPFEWGHCLRELDALRLSGVDAICTDHPDIAIDYYSDLR